MGRAARASLSEPICRLVGRLRITPSDIGVRWLFVLGSVFAFGGVAATLHRNGSLKGDARLLQWLHRRRTPQLTRVMLYATELGSVEVLTSLSSLVTLALLLRRQRRAAAFFAITASGATLINQTLKLAFGRARPDSSLQLSRTTGFAFPSGHSMTSAAIYGGLAMVVARRYPRLTPVVNASCGLAVLAVGSSRAYLHVHYPSDVVTGWALGLAWPVSLNGLLR
jgi:membrane-associated phospholipid phosphatase